MSLRKPYKGGRPFWMRTSGPHVERLHSVSVRERCIAAHALLRGLLEAVGGRLARDH